MGIYKSKKVSESGLFTGTKEYVRYLFVEVEQSWNIEVDSQIIVSTDYTWGYDYKKSNSYLITSVA